MPLVFLKTDFLVVPGLFCNLLSIIWSHLLWNFWAFELFWKKKASVSWNCIVLPPFQKWKFVLFISALENSQNALIVSCDARLWDQSFSWLLCLWCQTRHYPLNIKRQRGTLNQVSSSLLREVAHLLCEVPLVASASLSFLLMWCQNFLNTVFLDSDEFLSCWVSSRSSENIQRELTKSRLIAGSSTIYSCVPGLSWKSDA